MNERITYAELKKRVAELELQVASFQSKATEQGTRPNPTHSGNIEQIRAEEMLGRSQLILRNIIDISPFHVVCLDCEGKYIIANKSYCESFGKNPHEIVGVHYSQVIPHQLSKRHRSFIERALSGETVEFEDSNPPGSKVPQYAYGVYTPFGNQQGELLGCVAYVVDITDRKKAEIKLQEETNKLGIALDKVKKLSGLLPICMHCKKIRDEKGYWKQIESYIREHSEAEFSHSVCMECAKKYYPDIDIYGDEENS